MLFDFSDATGGNPESGVVFDKTGNLYGTLADAIYQLTQGSGGWNEKAIDKMPGTDLTLDPAGNLYSTADSPKLGIVFELMHGSWKEKTLYPCGGGPYAGVIFDKHRNLYGTTSYGGKYQAGSVFKLTPGAKGKWKETILHRFSGSDGRTPSMEQLVLDDEGNIYGTTTLGGMSGCGYGCGVVFEITP